MTKDNLGRISALHLALAAGFLVTVLLTVVASYGGTLPGDMTISRSIQSLHTAGATAVVRFLNSVFDVPTLIVITTLLSLALGIIGRYAQMVLLAATMLSQVTNAALKFIVGRPRPEDGVVHVTEQASGLSFPSGHTMGTVVFCGIIIYLAFHLIKHRPVRLLVQGLAIVQMFAIGFSRVYTGAHWPSDVLGGFIWGAWFVFVLIVCYRHIAPRFASNAALT